LIYDVYRRGLTNIAPRDIHEFFDLKKKVHPEINKWSPQTRLSIASHYLSAMRDFDSPRTNAKSQPALGQEVNQAQAVGLPERFAWFVPCRSPATEKKTIPATSPATKITLNRQNHIFLPLNSSIFLSSFVF
jgi:hypothetical protein